MGMFQSVAENFINKLDPFLPVFLVGIAAIIFLKLYILLFEVLGCHCSGDKDFIEFFVFSFYP